MRLYCESCEETCNVGTVEEEYYPGYFTTLYVSDCCGEMVVDELGKWIPQGILKLKFIEEESYNIDPMSEMAWIRGKL